MEETIKVTMREQPVKGVARFLLDNGCDLVSGWRKNRKDNWLRRIPSRVANRLIRKITQVGLHDYGCSLKIFRSDVIKHVRLYGEMHRFIPAYANWAGARVTELAVNHRARKYGQSKYGINRTIKVLLDLLTLKFLSSYSTKPIQLFGGVGALCFLFGFLSFALVLYSRFFEGVRANRNPVLLMGVFMFMAGLLFITQGLLAELVTRTYHESQGKTTYVIKAVIGRRPSLFARLGKGAPDAGHRPRSRRRRLKSDADRRQPSLAGVAGPTGDGPRDAAGGQ